MAEAVKLYGMVASPFSARVDIALRLKGVDYEYCKEEYGNKSADLLRYNPVHKKLPVLLHNGKPMPESLVIVEYIDETWDEAYAILPSDPYERAQARFWARFIDDKCQLTLWKACSEKEGQGKTIEEAVQLLKILENELGDRKFFGGETIGFVDIAGCFVAHWLRVIQEVCAIEIMTEERFPRLCRWGDAFACHEVVERALPKKEHLRDIFTSHFNGNSSK